MAVHMGQLRFSTQGHGDVVDLTEGVESVVQAAGVESGVACVSTWQQLVLVDFDDRPESAPWSSK